MGDLNADLLSTSDDSKFVRKLNDELSLQLVQHGPTHITPSSSTWIDAIMVDKEDLIISFTNSETAWPGKHNIIDVAIKVEIPEPVLKSFKYRDYKNIDREILNNLLGEFSWPSLTVDCDVANSLSTLNHNLMEAIDALAPIKMIKPSKTKPPWIGGELQGLCNKRDAVGRRFRRTGKLEFRLEYLRLRNLAAAKIEEAQKSFIRNKLTSALQHNCVWAELRRLGLLPGVKRGGLNGFNPEELGEYFAGISVSTSVSVAALDDIILTSNNSGFSFRKILHRDVVDAVSYFSSQATGDDGIPQSVIAKSLPTLGPILVELFNHSLESGVFPDTWKKAHVIPLKKCTAPTSCSEFRPISILCFLSKVLEKIVHSQITNYFSGLGFLDPMQSGFRQHYSTQSALIKLTDDIRMGISRGMLTLLLQFDFSKAFDTVSPSRLLSCLRESGFSRNALMWVRSYLLGREQIVITSDGDRSAPRSTNLGVPQGSVLGPLLFCAYINDLGALLGAAKISYIMYADDLQVYVQTPPANLPEGINELQRAATIVSNWAEGALLKLNRTKTKAILFGSARYINALTSAGLPSVDLGGGAIVPFSETVESLGVILDSKLSWKAHINSVTAKVNKTLYSLRFFRRFTNEDLRIKLCQALVFPLLDYCTTVFLDLSLEQQGRLQMLQNSCVRYISGLRMDEHVTPFRERLGWLSIASRQKYFIAVQTYKVLRLQTPSYLAEMFTYYASSRALRGNSMPELRIPKVSRQIAWNSFQVSGARLWNSLPADLRALPLNAFKRGMREYLLTIEFPTRVATRT